MMSKGQERPDLILFQVQPRWRLTRERLQVLHRAKPARRAASSVDSIPMAFGSPAWQSDKIIRIPHSSANAL